MECTSGCFVVNFLQFHTFVISSYILPSDDELICDNVISEDDELILPRVVSWPFSYKSPTCNII